MTTINITPDEEVTNNIIQADCNYAYRDVTGDECHEAVIQLQKGFIPVRRCSICEDPIGFETDGSVLTWNGQCGCTSSHNQTVKQWDDIAKLINKQTSEQHRALLKKRFGFTIADHVPCAVDEFN